MLPNCCNALLQAWTAEQLPHPLHEQAAAIADTLYSATRPLHEQAAPVCRGAEAATGVLLAFSVASLHESPRTGACAAILCS